ncbi:MAG: alpha/beta hydrolase [Actinomycetota bacterium]
MSSSSITPRTTSAVLPEAKFLIPVEGGELAVFRYGAENGKPVLLIHGVTSSNRAWQFFAVELQKRGYTGYAVDLRGRGASNQLESPFGMASHARDMAAVIDNLGLASIEVIGHSMGAFVAAALVGLYPTKVSRTTLVDGGIPLPLPAGMTVAQVLPFVLGPALARLTMEFESQEAYREFWKTNPALGTIWNSALDEYSDYDLQGEAPHLRPTSRIDAVEQDSEDLFVSELIDISLRNLTQEVLLLRAVRGLKNEETPLYPLPVLDAVLQKYPKIVVKTIDDVNHYGILLSESGAQKCAEVIFS